MKAPKFIQKITKEKRRIRWLSWIETKKSFFITLVTIVVMSLIFFGVTIGITEFLKVIGAL